MFVYPHRNNTTTGTCRFVYRVPIWINQIPRSWIRSTWLADPIHHTMKSTLKKMDGTLANHIKVGEGPEREALLRALRRIKFDQLPEKHTNFLHRHIEKNLIIVPTASGAVEVYMDYNGQSALFGSLPNAFNSPSLVEDILSLVAPEFAMGEGDFKPGKGQREEKYNANLNPKVGAAKNNISLSDPPDNWYAKYMYLAKLGEEEMSEAKEDGRWKGIVDEFTKFMKALEFEFRNFKGGLLQPEKSLARELREQLKSFFYKSDDYLTMAKEDEKYFRYSGYNLEYMVKLAELFIQNKEKKQDISAVKVKGDLRDFNLARFIIEKMKDHQQLRAQLLQFNFPYVRNVNDIPGLDAALRILEAVKLAGGKSVNYTDVDSASTSVVPLPPIAKDM